VGELIGGDNRDKGDKGDKEDKEDKGKKAVCCVQMGVLTDYKKLILVKREGVNSLSLCPMPYALCPMPYSPLPTLNQ
jgi:hypothetical protein